MKKAVIGILAHVDAGKTTLAEAILFKTGTIRKAGRIDNKNTHLDSHILEKERGITIFASQATFSYNDTAFTLLDTPGHVDFSAETERILQVLDYAVLVISGLDGVQSHTKTLWNLLRLYNIPTFVFVTKMDFARKTKSELLSAIVSELDDNCIDFTEKNAAFLERTAECSEKALDCFLETGGIDDSIISELVNSRIIFPVMFGSGLKFEGIDEFLKTVSRYITPGIYSDKLGAKVFKITHDESGAKITHLKITGGVLRVRDSIDLNGSTQKISQIRIYNGSKYTHVDEVFAGDVCAVTGLDNAVNGMGLGSEARSAAPFLEPVMNYSVVLPNGTDAQALMPKLKSLEEEDPMLKVTWNSFLQEIHVGLMGEIQAEILKSLVEERFGVSISIESGKVMYKETITNTVEGVGHYEPLRHYAEVHLLLEPLPCGTGLIFESAVKEDDLDRNWQRLIMMHLTEKEHLGVLTGSPVTDLKITLAAGRSHLKHTEGGDFRQATYRAVRQGLMQARSKLLEPWYSFLLEIPSEYLGRAINDIRTMHGDFESPETEGSMAVIRGKSPVTKMNGYSSEVASYTSGKGRLLCSLAGYFDCHNEDEVIKDSKYSGFRILRSRRRIYRKMG